MWPVVPCVWSFIGLSQALFKALVGEAPSHDNRGHHQLAQGLGKQRYLWWGCWEWVPEICKPGSKDCSSWSHAKPERIKLKPFLDAQASLGSMLKSQWVINVLEIWQRFEIFSRLLTIVWYWFRLVVKVGRQGWSSRSLSFEFFYLFTSQSAFPTIKSVPGDVVLVNNQK